MSSMDYVSYTEEPRHGSEQSARRRSTAGFTLAEVLAALVFMAIVIPARHRGDAYRQPAPARWRRAKAKPPAWRNAC